MIMLFKVVAFALIPLVTHAADKSSCAKTTKGLLSRPGYYLSLKNEKSSSILLRNLREEGARFDSTIELITVIPKESWQTIVVHVNRDQKQISREIFNQVVKSIESMSDPEASSLTDPMTDWRQHEYDQLRRNLIDTENKIIGLENFLELDEVQQADLLKKAHSAVDDTFADLRQSTASDSKALAIKWLAEYKGAKADIERRLETKERPESETVVQVEEIEKNEQSLYARYSITFKGDVSRMFTSGKKFEDPDVQSRKFLTSAVMARISSLLFKNFGIKNEEGLLDLDLQRPSLLDYPDQTKPKDRKLH